MLMRLKTLAAIFAALCSSAHASTPTTIRLTQLYDEARIVGIFEIMEGKVVSPRGQWCGARYKARAIEGLKNVSPGTIMEVGYLPNLKIGSSYLLVLGEFEAHPPNIKSEEEFRATCKPLLPTNTIMGVWRGAMEVEGDTSNQAKRSTWTVRLPRYVDYPLGTRTIQVNGERHLWFSDLVKRLAGER